MLVKTNGIVLNNTKYSENSIISHIFTRDYGKLSFIVNGVRNNKGAIKSSHLQSLNLLELDLYYSNNKTIHRIKDLKVSPILHDIQQNPIKMAMVCLVTEILVKTIKAEDRNEKLFDFIYSLVLSLNNTAVNKLGSFPSFFIANLVSILGHEINNMAVIHKSTSNKDIVYKSNQKHSIGSLAMTYMDINNISKMTGEKFENIIKIKNRINYNRLMFYKLVDYLEKTLLENNKIKSINIIKEILA